MARNRQREIVLAALAVVLIGTAVWLTRSSAPEAAITNTPPATTPPLGQAARDKRTLTEVDLQGLEKPRPEPEDSDRNPFAFKPKPPPPPPPQPVRPINPVPSDIGPVQPPPPPPIPLKFIGVADSGRNGQVGRVAVLSDGRGAVIYGREGETIDGRYRILKIGVESIDLAYLDGRGRQTIRLTGQ